MEGGFVGIKSIEHKKKTSYHLESINHVLSSFTAPKDIV